jgi:tetrahydromethanopterin S-methyltransferase subunit C
MAGDLLVVSRDAELPSVCMKCGMRDEIVRRNVKFQWTPVWARFLVFCLVGAIIMLVTTKRANLEVPLCVRCDAQWGTARTGTIVGVVALLAALVAMRVSDEHGALALGVLAVVLAAFVTFSVLYVRPRMLQVKRIDDAELTLKGVAPAAAEYISGGSR